MEGEVSECLSNGSHERGKVEKPTKATNEKEVEGT